MSAAARASANRADEHTFSRGEREREREREREEREREREIVFLGDLTCPRPKAEHLLEQRARMSSFVAQPDSRRHVLRARDSFCSVLSTEHVLVHDRRRIDAAARLSRDISISVIVMARGHM